MVDSIGVWVVVELLREPITPFDQRSRIDWSKAWNPKHLAYLDIRRCLNAIGRKRGFLGLSYTADLHVPDTIALQITCELTLATNRLVVRDLLTFFTGEALERMLRFDE